MVSMNWLKRLTLPSRRSYTCTTPRSSDLPVAFPVPLYRTATAIPSADS